MILKQIQQFALSMQKVWRIRFDKSPIKRIPQLADFVSTRSAYVAQTSLFGYLKTRMGREYVEIFTDEKFLPSIQYAKWRVYGACLSDLTIFATALVAYRSDLGHENTVALAKQLHDLCVVNTFKGEFAEQCHDITDSEFKARATKTIWANSAIGDTAFSLSPVILIESAPVTHEFKDLDCEIVTNSIKLRWADVRNQLTKRLDSAAVRADFLVDVPPSPKVIDIPRLKRRANE